MEGGGGGVKTKALLWPLSHLVTTPCPVLALLLNKLSLAVVQMLNFLNKS